MRDELQVTANRGSRFGLLRYAASADVRARLARVPQPEVMVNYLGDFGQLEAGTTFRLAQERVGPLFALEDPRPHLWQVVGGLFSGELRLQCIYSRNRHRAETMDRLMTRVARQASRDRRRRDRERNARGGPDVRGPWRVRGRRRADRGWARGVGMRRTDIEHVGALTPVQLGMLFHVLHEPDAALYVEQGVCDLDGPLDIEAFRAAWQATIDRHAALRTAFFWRELSQPLQVTYRSVAMPLMVTEASDGSADQAADDVPVVERIMARHRTELRAIERAPLMRLDLIARGADRWTAIWSIHHLVHDAWSLEVILREVWNEYDARRRGTTARAAFRRGRSRTSSHGRT